VPSANLDDKPDRGEIEQKQVETKLLIDLGEHRFSRKAPRAGDHEI
jgi:hypothetical protein